MPDPIVIPDIRASPQSPLRAAPQGRVNLFEEKTPGHWLARQHVSVTSSGGIGRKTPACDVVGQNGLLTTSHIFDVTPGHHCRQAAPAERDGAVCSPGKIVCENQPTTGHYEGQYLNISILVRTINGRGEQGGGTRAHGGDRLHQSSVCASPEPSRAPLTHSTVGLKNSSTRLSLIRKSLIRDDVKYLGRPRCSTWCSTAVLHRQFRRFEKCPVYWVSCTSNHNSIGIQTPPAALERRTASTIATPAKPSSIVGKVSAGSAKEAVRLATIAVATSV